MRVQLHRSVVPGRIKLPQHVRISQEFLVNLLDHQRCLLGGTGNHGDQASRIQHAQGDTADRNKPCLACATALNLINVTIQAKDTGIDPLERFQPDLEVILNEPIQMRPPVPDLFCPGLEVFDIPDLRELDGGRHHLMSIPIDCNVYLYA